MPTAKRPFLFLAVGIFNTLTDYLFYTFLTQVVLTNPNSLALAGIISGTVALIVAFTTHSLITWRGRNITSRTLIKFILVTGAGMWILRPVLLVLFFNLTWLYDWIRSLTQLVGLPFNYEFIAHSGAFVFMAVILLIYNYLTYDRFVYSTKSNNSNDIDRKSHSTS